MTETTGRHCSQCTRPIRKHEQAVHVRCCQAELAATVARFREYSDLSAAWLRAEAAVHESGRSFLRLTVHPHNYDAKGGPIPPRPWYYASCNWVPGELGEDAGGITPAAALNALADKLEPLRRP